MKLLLFIVVLLPSLCLAGALTDEQVRSMIIRDSIASYSGKCACPYNVTRNGSACGRRSAYSKPGGASPLCYPQDVSPEMIKRYRGM
jgi:hypothetical protein